MLVDLGDLLDQANDDVMVDLLMIGTAAEIDGKDVGVEQEPRLERIHDEGAVAPSADHPVGTDGLGAAPLEEPSTAWNPEESAGSKRERHDSNPASPSVKASDFLQV